MTSPPPSETGATAEDYIQAANVVARFNADASPSTLSMRRKVLLGDLVAEAIAAAKRSAHLEDARAGCEYCGNKWPALGFNPQPSPDTIRRWVHVKINDAGYYAADCARPEVWDALARTGAK